MPVRTQTSTTCPRFDPRRSLATTLSRTLRVLRDPGNSTSLRDAEGIGPDDGTRPGFRCSGAPVMTTRATASALSDAIGLCRASGTTLADNRVSAAVAPAGVGYSDSAPTPFARATPWSSSRWPIPDMRLPWTTRHCRNPSAATDSCLRGDRPCPELGMRHGRFRRCFALLTGSPDLFPGIFFVIASHPRGTTA